MTMLKRVFSNLFSNIIKYGDKQDTVTVSVKHTPDCISINLTNAIKKDFSDVESNRIGLKSAEKMMQLMNGTAAIHKTAALFSVSLLLRNSERVL